MISEGGGCMFKIGDFSKLSNISVRSLRHYESLGLLTPVEIDRFTGYRYYSAGQLDTANKIRMLREVGFSLDAIKGLLDVDSLSSARQYYELRQMEVEEELGSLKRKKEMLGLLLDDMEENNDMNCYNVVEKDIPAKTVLRNRKILPSYEHVKDFWTEFFAEIQSSGLIPKEPLFLRSLCLDKEFKESNVDVELHIEVDDNAKKEMPDRIVLTPSVHVVTVTFAGGHNKGYAVRRALARWLEVNHYGLGGTRFNMQHLLNQSGTMFNIPHVMNFDDPDPDHWINEWGFELVKQ
jgi:DNA-binding transcriptional MerR regulator